MMIAMHALDPKWREEVKERTKQAMQALVAKGVDNDDAGNDKVVGYGDLATSVAVVSNVLANVILSAYEHGKDSITANFSLLAILEDVTTVFKENGLNIEIMNLSDVNSAVDELKKSAGFSK